MTKSHFLQYAEFVVSRSLDACQLNWSLNFFFSSLWRLCSFLCLLGISFSSFCAVYPLKKYRFILEEDTNLSFKKMVWYGILEFNVPLDTSFRRNKFSK